MEKALVMMFLRSLIRKAVKKNTVERVLETIDDIDMFLDMMRAELLEDAGDKE